MSRVNLSANSGFFHCCHLKLPLLIHSLGNGGACFACSMWTESEKINVFLFALCVDLWETHSLANIKYGSSRSFNQSRAIYDYSFARRLLPSTPPFS